MKQAVIPGAKLDILTPQEAAELLAASYRHEVETRVRAEATGALDAGGRATLEVYVIPPGYEFELRRFVVTGAGMTPKVTSAINYGAWLRSGELVAYLTSNGAFAAALPAQDGYGDEQGVYLRNGEVLELFLDTALAANTGVQVTVEGILRRPPKNRT